MTWLGWLEENDTNERLMTATSGLVTPDEQYCYLLIARKAVGRWKHVLHFILVMTIFFALFYLLKERLKWSTYIVIPVTTGATYLVRRLVQSSLDKAQHKRLAQALYNDNI